ncbi:MAG TPA: hypothetical protein VGQ76_24040 [Thermoanaerobaculia bacterium]|jgi:hypothetical protein|nr:hypothetical protein [Thermoanaerobaculia bacterium]
MAQPADLTMNGAPRLQLNWAARTMLVVTLLTAFIPMWYGASTPETSGPLVTVLLLLPSVLIAFGANSLLPIPQKPVILTLCITGFDVLKNLLVWGYVLALKGGMNSATVKLLSNVSLLIGALLAFAVYKLTSWMMNHESGQEAKEDQGQSKEKPWLEGLIQQLRRHRFLSICGLLVTYLHLLLFLSMSIAFHDRVVKGGSIERLVPG